MSDTSTVPGANVSAIQKSAARVFFDLPRQHEMPDHNAAAEKAVFVQLERARVLDHTLYGPFAAAG